MSPIATLAVTISAFGCCLSLLAACVGSDADAARTAADPAVEAAPTSSGSGILRLGFDPSALAPKAAPAAVDPHAGHNMDSSSQGSPNSAPVDPHAGHKMGGAPAASTSPDPHAGHAMPPSAPHAAPPSSGSSAVHGAPTTSAQPPSSPPIKAPPPKVPASAQPAAPPAPGTMPPGHKMWVLEALGTAS